MKILRSTPFVLLYISVAILVAGCVLGGLREVFKPFDVVPLAWAMGLMGTAFTICTTAIAAVFVWDKIDDGYFDEEDDDGN